MSVLIKGMEMPTNCDDCRFAVDGWCYACISESDADRQRITTNYCPLVPVPPHGRLIDADALDREFTALRWDDNGLAHWGDRKDWCLQGSEIEALISAAPTIIPASEEGE